MNICKNVDCKIEIAKNRIYCSLKCRNYYVNKYIRDYTKNGEGLSKDTRQLYLNNLKYCLNPKCCKVIPYEKRKNSYCSQSCGASISNIGKVASVDTRTKMSLTHRSNQVQKLIKCKNCDKLIPINKRKLFCSDECKFLLRRKDMSELSKYKQDTHFKFNLSDYPNEFDFKLIEQFGWYKPKNRGDNLGGVSRDHMYSVRDGFNNKIDAQLLAHPANCKLMIHNENVSKNKKSSITYDELIERIKRWSERY
jgi:hypothetical protein